MLGPLGEANRRAAPGRARKRIEGLPPDDWSPGELPPDVAAPLLLACATFLAEENDEPSGITWDQRFLAVGEGERIDAETLVWHLTFAEGATVRQICAKPPVQPFARLLAALNADIDCVAAQHEARRRRWRMALSP